MAKSMSKRTTTVKTENSEPITENIATVKVETKDTETTKTKKVYEPEDLIPCKSIVSGLLLAVGEKTKLVYRWADYGDIENIEYQDLLFMLRARDKAVFLPRFVILDDEFVSQHPELNDLYSTLYSMRDIRDILNLPLAQMKEAIIQLPPVIQKSILNVAATMIERKQFDSVQKIKALDEIFDTKLFLTLTLE